eukprot:UN12299
MLKSEFRHKIGTLTKRTGTASILGCLVGPCIGGLLYSIDPRSEIGFRYPFVFYFCRNNIKYISSVLFMDTSRYNGHYERSPSP